LKVEFLEGIRKQKVFGRKLDFIEGFPLLSESNMNVSSKEVQGTETETNED
jgi:hypothetical protein